MEDIFCCYKHLADIVLFLEECSRISPGILDQETWQVDGRSGKNVPVEISTESLQWFSLVALNIYILSSGIPCFFLTLIPFTNFCKT